MWKFCSSKQNNWIEEIINQTLKRIAKNVVKKEEKTFKIVKFLLT